MSTGFVHLANNVKVEWIDIVVKRLVIQKELGKQTKILTIYSALFSVNFIDAKPWFSVNLLARRTSLVACFLVLSECLLGFGIFEAELADMERFCMRIFFRIRGKVPTFNFKRSHTNLFNVLDLGGLLVLLFEGRKARVSGSTMPIATCQEIGIVATIVSIRSR